MPCINGNLLCLICPEKFGDCPELRDHYKTHDVDAIGKVGYPKEWVFNYEKGKVKHDKKSLRSFYDSTNMRMRSNHTLIHSEILQRVLAAD